MTINLKDTTFIIPLRIDHEDRLINANITLNYLTKHFDTNIILLEDGEKSHYKEFNVENDTNIKYIFIENKEEIFYRTKYLNIMLKQVKTPVVVNYDIDILLPLESYIIAQHMIINENYDVIYPFSNPPGVYYIDQKYKDLIKPNYDLKCYDKIKEIINKVQIQYSNDENKKNEKNDENDEKKEVFNEAGLGFCIFFNTNTYLLFGGENEEFYGWGPEDQERAYRFFCMNAKINSEIEKKNQFKVYYPEKHLYVDMYCKCFMNYTCGHKNKYNIENYILKLIKNTFSGVYHLEHWRGVNSDDSHKVFKNNKELWNKILNMSKPKLFEYYEKKSFFDKDIFFKNCKKHGIQINKNESVFKLFKRWNILKKSYDLPFPLK